MQRVGGLKVPQIVVSEERELRSVPSIKISIEGVSSSESEDDTEKPRPTRLRPNAYRWLMTNDKTRDTLLCELTKANIIFTTFRSCKRSDSAILFILDVRH